MLYADTSVTVAVGLLRTNAYHKAIFTHGTFTSVVSAEAQDWISVKIEVPSYLGWCSLSLGQGWAKAGSEKCALLIAPKLSVGKQDFCFRCLLPSSVQTRGKCHCGVSLVLPLQVFKTLQYFFMSYCNTTIILYNLCRDCIAEAAVL